MDRNQIQWYQPNLAYRDCCQVQQQRDGVRSTIESRDRMAKVECDVDKIVPQSLLSSRRFRFSVSGRGEGRRVRQGTVDSERVTEGAISAQLVLLCVICQPEVRRRSGRAVRGLTRQRKFDGCWLRKKKFLRGPAVESGISNPARNLTSCCSLLKSHF